MRSHPEMRHVPLRYRGAYNLGFCLERYFPKSERVRKIKSTARRRIVDAVRCGGKGRLLQVERRKDLTPAEFRKRYLEELRAREEAWRPLLSAARRGRVTLVYAARDEVRSGAVVLKAFLEQRLRGPAGRARRPTRRSRIHPS